MTPDNATISYATLERMARDLCESARGPNAWAKPRCQRNHWRAVARKTIERERGIATADALMAVFGMRRVGA